MELFSNLAWAVTVIAMLVVWLASRRRVRRGTVLPAIGVQIIAFAMTSVILLPAISVTDDLNACVIPAEVERTCGWNHRNLAPVDVPHRLPIALALLTSLLRPTHLRTVAMLTTDEPVSCHPFDFGRKLWSRPPPAA